MAIRRFDIDALLPLLSNGFTLLTPNNRGVDGILREYANGFRSSSEKIKTWERPAVFAIDIYIQQLWQLAASQGIAPFNETQLKNIRFSIAKKRQTQSREAIDSFNNGTLLRALIRNAIAAQSTFRHF